MLLSHFHTHRPFRQVAHHGWEAGGFSSADAQAPVCGVRTINASQDARDYYGGQETRLQRESQGVGFVRKQARRNGHMGD